MKRILKHISPDKKIQKSISFRVFATMGTFAVAWAFTGNPFLSLPIAGAQAITNTAIYYWHEGQWDAPKPAVLGNSRKPLFSFVEPNIKQVMREVKSKEDERLHKEFMKHFKE